MVRHYATLCNNMGTQNGEILRKMVIKRVCEWCGKEFAAKTVRTRFCSDKCRKTAYKHTKRVEFISNYDLKANGHGKDYNVAEHEVMTVQLASMYLFVNRATVYRYIASGILKAVHLPGKTLIRKSDIDAMFSSVEGLPERVQIPREKKPAEYTTVKETAERYSLSLAGVYKILKENKVPSCMHRNKTYYSLPHVTRLFAKREKESFPEITEWYTCEEIMRRYGMTQSAVYCMINASGIPSKRIKRISYYSKRHVDILKQNDVPQGPDYYTVEECMARYGYTRDQVYHYLRYYSIDRVRKGKFTLFLKSDFDRLFEKPEPG